MDSCVQSCVRMRRLQKLCGDAHVDALIFVAGVDGGDHVGSCQALSYLLQGLSGRDLISATKVDSSLEDVIVVIYPDHAAVHCTPDSYAKLLPVVRVWGPMTRLYCCSGAEADDPDALEMFKIHAFVSMMAGVKKVGMALTPKPAPTKDGPPPAKDDGSKARLEVESWPLFQAYGLEGIGRRGFFTMSTEVVDVYSELLNLYCQLDSAAFTHQLNHALPMLVQHWKELLTLFDTRSASERLQLSERLAGEPLLSYFAYGTLRPVPGVSRAITMAPRVVFGTNTNQDRANPSGTKLGVAGSGDTPALHMVVEAADPRGPLRVGRTYFLSHGVCASLEALGSHRDLELALEEEQDQDQVGQSEVSQRQQEADVRLLMLLYLSLIDAAQAAIRHFSLGGQDQGADIARSAKDAARDALEAAAAARGCSGALQSLLLDQDRLRFAVWSCSDINTTSAPVRGQRHLKVIRLALNDIHSTDGEGRLLGGLVFAETFMEVPGAEPGAPSRIVVLTSGIPPLVSWCAGGVREERAAGRIEQAVQKLMGSKPPSHPDGLQAPESLPLGQEGLLQTSLGAPLQDATEEVLLCLPCTGLPAVLGSWVCFEGGLVFMSPNLAPLVIHFASHITSAGLLSPPRSSSLPARFLLSCNTRPVCGPLEVLTPEWVEIGFSLGPMRVSALRHFHSVILPRWEANLRMLDLPYQVDVPTRTSKEFSSTQQGTSCQDSALALAQRYAESAELGKKFPLLMLDEEAVDCAAALDFQELKCQPQHSWAPIAAWQSVTPSEENASASVPLLLVTGPPAGGQDILLDSILRLVSAEYNWVVVREPLACGGGMRPSVPRLQASLTEALRRCKEIITEHSAPPAAAGSSGGAASQQEGDASRRRMPHLVLVMQSHTPVSVLLSSLQKTSAVSSGACYLRCVTACLRAGACLQGSRGTPRPGTLAFMQPGLVDNMLIFGQKAEVAMVQSLASAFDPRMRVVHATKSQLMRLGDTFISPGPQPTAQTLLHMQAAGYLSACPPGVEEVAKGTRGNASQDGVTGVDVLYIKVAGALDKSKVEKMVGSLVPATWWQAEGREPVVEEETLLTTPRALHIQVYLQRWSYAESSMEVVELVGTPAGLMVSGEGVKGGSGGSSEGSGSEDENGVLRKACTSLSPEDDGAEFLITGLALNLQEIKELVEGCKAESVGPKHRTRASLTQEELSAIQEEHTLDPLPPGWFYNGTMYVDFENTATALHPNIEEHVQAYLISHNEELEKKNASASSHKPISFGIESAEFL